MSFPVLPSPASLIAVALVMNRSHEDGPSFVFHYPEKVSPFDDIKETAAPDDLIIQRLSQPEEEALGTTAGHNKSNSPQWTRGEMLEHDALDDMPWETFAGFPTRDLASILTPKRSYHKMLFHLSLDLIHCISRPTHVPESGVWKRAKRRKKAKGKSVARQEESLSPKTRAEGEGLDVAVETGVGTETETEGEGKVTTDEDYEEGEHQNEKETRESDGEKEKEEVDEPGPQAEKPSSMTMFNLVFFLTPKKHETNELVETVYNRILKKTTRTLCHTQIQSDFVWKESKRILALKEKGREQKLSMHALWSEILATSSLASSIRELYIAASTNRIATLQLETSAGTFTPSVQIPFPYAISVLPPEGAVEQQGIWLTTANAILSDDVANDPEVMDRTFGMLLLGSDKKIIAELESDRDGTTMAMVEFVKLAAQPNVTFHQMAKTKHLTIHQVREFARHFIFWRRGIAIPPLFSRDTYIASPNLCPSRLPRAALEWQRAFPLAPPLPTILAEISAAPRPWKSICPHKNQRPEYMKMLAWLMRDGWVTQLCTFSYVVVWPEIIYEVQYNQEAAELRAAREKEMQEKAEARANASSANSSASTSPPSPPSHLSRSPPNSATPSVAPPSSTASVSGAASSSGPVSPTSSRPQIGRAITGAAAALLASRASMSASPAPALPRSNASHTPDQHALAENARKVRAAQQRRLEAHEKQTAHARKTPPMATRHPSMNEAVHLHGIDPYIILDARRATGLEAQYLDAIKGRFERESTREAWQRFAKYFNGRNALERIPLLEDMKKRDVVGEIEEMSEYLLCVRHW